MLEYKYAGGNGIDASISRVSSLEETVNSVTTVLEAYDYLGLSTIVQRRRPQPGSDLTYYGTGAAGDAGDQYAGLDRFDRVVDQWWKSGSNATDRFTYGYDENSNRVWKEVKGTNAPLTMDEVYVYDNLNRLTDVGRGEVTSGSISNVNWYQAWTLDALGNWTAFDDAGASQTRTHNARNQITGGSSFAFSPTFDNNGNQTQDETGKDYRYDAWNRVAGVDVNGDNDFSDNGDIKYRYDAFDRRISEEVIGGTTTHFYYSAEWQVLEEREGSGSSAKRQNVWGQGYVDALILRDRDVVSGGDLGKTGSGLDERLYAQQDANYNVTSLVSTSGSVVERYQYAPYGGVTVLNGAADKDAPVTEWSADANNTSDWDWIYLHKSGRYSTSSGNYHVRNRDFDPSLGRWNRMDPLGYVDAFNLYEYVASSPDHQDPLGLFGCSSPTPPPWDCCAWAATTPWPINPMTGKPDWGGVMCCNGVMTACDWSAAFGRPPGKKEADGIIHACVIEHENDHFKNTQKCTPGTTYRPNLFPSVSNVLSECAADRAQLNCLVKSQSLCMDKPCADQVQKEINVVAGRLMANKCV